MKGGDESMKYYESLNQGNLKTVELLENINKNGIKITDDFWQNFMLQGSGAFLGAFFAFLFGFLTFWMQKKRERFFKHKNAVVELEYLLNEHLNDIAKNSFLLTHDIDILKRRHFTYDRLYAFRIPIDLELRLGDLDIINRHFSYRESISRLNADFSKINAAFDNLTNFTLAYGRKPDEGNFTHLIQQMELLIKFLDLVVDEAKSLLAFTRIYLRRLESFKEKGLNIYKLSGYSLITDKEMKKESTILNKEIDETMKESRERIRKASE